MTTKPKGQCQFGIMLGDGDRCQEPATRKWGDHWFCESHGRRDKTPAMTTPDKCPGCGAEAMQGRSCLTFYCGAMWSLGGGLHQSRECLAAERDKAHKELNEAREVADLLLDDLHRLWALHPDSEARGILERAKCYSHQRIPLIIQRDEAERERDQLKAENERLRAERDQTLAALREAERCAGGLEMIARELMVAIRINANTGTIRLTEEQADQWRDQWLQRIEEVGK